MLTLESLPEFYPVMKTEVTESPSKCWHLHSLPWAVVGCADVKETLQRINYVFFLILNQLYLLSNFKSIMSSF